MRYVSITLLALTLCVPDAQAQSSANRGDIVGSVHDGTGAVIPGATVLVANVDRGFSRTVSSDASGQFQFLRLGAGDYTLTAALRASRRRL